MTLKRGAYKKCAPFFYEFLMFVAWNKSELVLLVAEVGLPQ
jgi:hypothetical protein